jgi:hypothetical protein
MADELECEIIIEIYFRGARNIVLNPSLYCNLTAQGLLDDEITKKIRNEQRHTPYVLCQGEAFIVYLSKISCAHIRIFLLHAGFSSSLKKKTFEVCDTPPPPISLRALLR